MQQPSTMMNVIPPFPPTNITTEQIQKYLDENKKLILAILDNQNLGKLAECAQYQAQLQKNLMYLAAIADAQPQAPTMPSQIPPHPAMQQGGHYMQHPQAVMSPSGFPPKIPMQFNPQQIQDQQQQLHQQHQHQHQQAVQSHMGIRPGVNGLQGMHPEVNLGGGSSGAPSPTGGLTDFSRSGAGPGSGASGGVGASSSSLDARGGKQDLVEAGTGDGQGNSAAGNDGNDGANEVPSHMKGLEDGK